MKPNLSSLFRRKYTLFRSWASILSNSKNLSQIINPKEIPFIIINFNQLYYLKNLVEFAKKRDFKNIIILDNVSTYPPLLEYYKTIEKEVTIERMEKNYGHLVFFQNPRLMKQYGENFFILTDADIEPNINLPANFMRKMVSVLLNNLPEILKVGFALRTDDIPSYYPNKEKVVNWENQFWKTEIEKDIYKANIDTTFALYKPNTKRFMTVFSNFYLALRIAGDFTAKHGGWYIDFKNPSEEEKYYFESVGKSSSWVMAQKDIENHKYL